ncbi:DUF1836 domain-containing protein [Clostridium sp. YIM B02515]|uniref:DUF1836 domain-containing protein n=1 Tax=Clostridium rhizosphaerae TaxID=2803861 RepID=A0ABS1TGG3_9CLOT|nr:DUF1836 domain-containing protein [Clostridium rhizosphaerae]MBL4938380.1 DUF1836 domain-containing protein [Clostridium rhizosphaerae]
MLKEDNEKMFKLIEEVSNYEDIKISDIPCVDLYMDQVTTFFDEKLKNLKRDNDEKILTKTMINNYAKAKLLLPVKGKKYSKDQMVLLALIYNLKQTLSINDTGLVLAPIIKKLSSSKESQILEEIYNTFLDINKVQMEEFNQWFKNKIELVNKKSLEIESNDEDLVQHILTVLMLTSSANMQKRMAEKIIDDYFKQVKEE